MSCILIACGGTGGHLAPGIALAEALQARGHACTLLISQKQVDSVLIKKYSHLNFHRIPGRGFSGGAFKQMRSFLSMIMGCFSSYRLLRRKKPDMVLLFGGFISIGIGFVARLAGVPIALHEANCYPGRAVRLLKYLAVRVYLPDGVRLKGVPSKRLRYFGYPVRQDIKHCLKAEAWERLDIAVKNKLLVLIGGSQGASVLNQWAIDHIDKLTKLELSVYCVAGIDKCPENSCLSDYGNSVKFVPFSDKMGDVISAADLIISRAGAGSIAEVIRCRAPAILIPYPYAKDDHQQANAVMHERHGAGVVVKESDLSRLMNEVENLIFNDWMLGKFKSNLVRLDRYDSAKLISSDIEALCEAQATNTLESAI